MRSVLWQLCRRKVNSDLFRWIFEEGIANGALDALFGFIDRFVAESDDLQAGQTFCHITFDLDKMPFESQRGDGKYFSNRTHSNRSKPQAALVGKLWYN